MKKIFYFSITIGAFILNCFICNSSYAKDVSINEIKQIENQAKQKIIESKKFQAQAISLNLELSKIDQNIISLANKIQNSEDSISKLEKELIFLSEDMETTEENFKNKNTSLIEILTALQNMSLNPSESVILQPLSPVDIIRSAILLRESVPFLSKKSSDLKEDLNNLQTKKEQVKINLEKTKSQMSLLEKQQQEMNALIKRKAELRTKIVSKGEETKKVAEELSSKAKDLRELLEELERQKEIARKKKLEAEKLAAIKRREEQKRQQKQTNITHTVDTKTHESIKKQVKSGRFVSAKGKLSRPVRGNISIEYGQETSKGVTSKGITYTTRPKAQVIAPFDGTVIFSGPFKGFGNIIIIEHGDGYLSLLAGLGNIDSELGQMLLQGEPVATMPNKIDSKLYVEIRKDRQPINPKPWIIN